MGKEIYEDFTDWLKEHGHLAWTDQNFSARFGQHPEVTAKGVQKEDPADGPANTLAPATVAVPEQRVTHPEAVRSVVGRQVPHSRRRSRKCRMTRADRKCVTARDGVGWSFS